jgi:hypothetical protein
MESVLKKGFKHMKFTQFSLLLLSLSLMALGCTKKEEAPPVEAPADTFYDDDMLDGSELEMPMDEDYDSTDEGM